MSLFQHNPKEARTLEDILTPKNVVNDEENEEETREEMSDNDADIGKDDVLGDTAVENAHKSVNKDIKIESREEGSFNALTCFGWSETKTPKWLIKCAHFWYGAMSLFWFIFGALTFAPIIFMQKKVSVVFKGKMKSLIFAACIYIGFLALIITLITARMR